MTIWSGEYFTGDQFECTDACDVSYLGSVGNDAARSAKCTCEALTSIGESNQIMDILQYLGVKSESHHFDQDVLLNYITTVK